MADKKPKSSEGSHVQADHGSTSVGSVNVGGNVDGGINIGNTIIHYHAANGEKREMRTGWFFGHRYGDLATFTGRATELNMLDTWLANDTDNLYLMTAFGGFGKSALAWTWFNRVDREQWQTAVWWSFYEKESGFESFLSETLKHLGVEVKQSARQQVNDLLEALRGTNILIVLDGFERLLRQYGRMDAALQSDDADADASVDPSQRDCSSPLTEIFLRGLSGAGMKSKVLMTTRLCPRALESADGKLLKSCRDEALSAFSPEDAVTYFHKEDIKGRRDEILAVCSAYGYHPLSLSLLVGLINEDHENRGDIAAVKNLEIFENVKARRHHVLERAYESLAPERRDLLSKISCFRGSMEYAVLKKVFPSPDLDKALLDLRKRGLLQYAGETGRYDMHPIVRHYAYDRLANSDKKDAHERLVDYFEAIPKPETVNALEDLSPVIELYYHLVSAEKYDTAYRMYADRLRWSLYYQFGAYELDLQLLLAIPHSPNGLPNLLLPSDQTWNLMYTTMCYERTGRLKSGLIASKQSVELNRKVRNQTNLASSLGTFALLSCEAGNLKIAIESLAESVKIFDDVGDANWRGISHRSYGKVLMFCGAFEKAESEFEVAQSAYNPRRAFHHGLSLLALYKGQLCLWQNKPYEALEFAQQTREFSLSDNLVREGVSADWLSGISLIQLLLSDSMPQQKSIKDIETYLTKALTGCRRINLIQLEPDILLAWARLCQINGDTFTAKKYAEDALVIAERCGYRLRQADIYNFLAFLALEQDKNNIRAKQYAETAKQLASCDSPPYYYKIVYVEAEKILERLSR